VTRFWPDGLLIAVSCDALATPQALVWAGHRHIVAAVVERWRVDEGWWRKRVWREYFTLTTESGLLLQIYHDVPSHSWRLQRLYD
jgi:hypothetical protein